MTKKNRDLIELAVSQANNSIEYYRENREKCLEDLEFVFSEDQWEPDVKSARGNRPCLNANDLPVFLDQVVGEQRMNRAGIKVIPVDSNTDPFKAEVIGGLIRNIEHVSDAHVAYDEALEFVAAGGYAGAIRIVTQYENEDLFDNAGNIKEAYNDDTAFDQEIRIVPVANPLNVLYDPSAKLWHKNDGDFMFYYEDINIDVYKEKYPRAGMIDFDAGELPTSLGGWYNQGDKTIRVAEWFLKEARGTKKVYLILDDYEKYQIVSVLPEGVKPIKEREVADYRIVWRLMSGTEVLEGPVEIPGRLFPLVPVWGKKINVNGIEKLRGMFRYVKDPQRMYIYSQSAATEMVALAPKSPFIGTPKMFEEHEGKWRTANTDLWPYLPYNIDEKAPGLRPTREPPPPVQTGLLTQASERQTEKRNIIGLQEASLGRRSNETSGLAIKERRRGGDMVTYAYVDNLNRAIRQVGRVIESMRPVIYNTPRIMRLRGIDGKESSVPVNQPYTDEDTGEERNVDLTIGKHDILMTTGPGYATQRIEMIDMLVRAMQYAPASANIIAPVMFDMMDMPHSDKIVKMLEAMLPPQVQAAISGEQNMTQEQVGQVVQQAVEEYKQSVVAQKEALKTEQQALKVEQEKLQLEQERLQTQQEEIKTIREAMGGMGG